MPTPTKTTDRKALHAYVSDEAHDAWHDKAARGGVSLSALLEALAAPVSVMDIDAVIADAREIDTERRRRNRRKS